MIELVVRTYFLVQLAIEDFFSYKPNTPLTHYVGPHIHLIAHITTHKNVFSIKSDFF